MKLHKMEIQVSQICTHMQYLSKWTAFTWGKIWVLLSWLLSSQKPADASTLKTGEGKENNKGWWLQIFERSQHHLDGVVGVGDDGDEEAEDHVDEKRHKGVEVDPAESPHQAALLLHVLKGGEHVVSVDQREQTFWHRVQGPKLESGKRLVSSVHYN